MNAVTGYRLQVSGDNVDDVRARMMALESASVFDERAWQMVCADLAAQGRVSALADAQRRMETARCNSATVDALIDRVFCQKRFTTWDVALVLRDHTSARVADCEKIARKIVRYARRDGLVEIVQRGSHFYKLAAGVSTETMRQERRRVGGVG